MPTPIPGNLPDRLTITLWDFSWYTRAGPGEPFEDLDRAFAAAVRRGYNTVRICAMPFLLFASGLDTQALHFTPLGGDYGRRTRWYDVQQEAVLDGRARLLALVQAARRHGCYVILSSWEYQQSTAFLADSSWSDAALAVPPAQRPDVLANALADLVDFLKTHALDDRIAFTELHNEVQGGRLTDDIDPSQDPILALQPRLEAAVERFRERAPGQLIAVNYAWVPTGSMRGVASNVDVAIFHPYVYGVLEELNRTFALRQPELPFPQQRADAELLREGAPPADEWLPPQIDRWRLHATIVPAREVYVHDWCDPVKYDRWLYERYATHRTSMRDVLRTWMLVAADWALNYDVPLVFGEGWVGYTPLLSTFEDGPVGAGICTEAVHQAAQLGAWGTVICSNAAPHHPMWDDVALQHRLNTDFAQGRR